MIVEVDDERQLQELQAQGKSFLIDFYATWCGPCKDLEVLLEALDDVTVLKVNVEKFSLLAKAYGVLSVPTLVKFYDGIPIALRVGVPPSIEALVEWTNE